MPKQLRIMSSQNLSQKILTKMPKMAIDSPVLVQGNHDGFYEIASSSIPISPMRLHEEDTKNAFCDDNWEFVDYFGGRGATANSSSFRRRATQILIFPGSAGKEMKTVRNTDCYATNETPSSVVDRDRRSFLPKISGVNSSGDSVPDKIDILKKRLGSDPISFSTFSPKNLGPIKSSSESAIIGPNVHPCQRLLRLTSDSPNSEAHWAWRGVPERPSFRCSNRPFGISDGWDEFSPSQPPVRRAEIRKSSSMDNLPSAHPHAKYLFNEFG